MSLEIAGAWAGEYAPGLVQSVRRQTLIDQVIDRLRREVATGNWPVGSRIPTEPALCQLTGAARNTVREAVQALVHAGMLDRRQGSGTYVVSSADQALGEYFARARESDLLELRETLEVTAAGLAAQRRTEEDVAELNGVLERRQSLLADEEATAADLVEADTAVHRAIVAASHNEVYLEFYDSLLPRMARGIELQLWQGDSAMEAEHAALVHAVVDGDVPAAREAASALLAEVRQRVGSAGSPGRDR